ncbi:hypothetical protein SRABI106_04526 [Rahnella aquatilis]|nr:hypothetical protein SRABI106_04526 [Rahnella aquatilis]
MTINAGRQPKEIARYPTIGPATAPPRGEPALSKPIAVAACFFGNQPLIILFAEAQIGPSAMPNNTRKISME